MLMPDLPVLIGESQRVTKGAAIIGIAIIVVIIGWSILSLIQRRREKR